MAYLTLLRSNLTLTTTGTCLLTVHLGVLNCNNSVFNGSSFCSALLWHKLMGRNVLSTSFSGTKNIRAYAHCSKLSVSLKTMKNPALKLLRVYNLF